MHGAMGSVPTARASQRGRGSLSIRGRPRTYGERTQDACAGAGRADGHRIEMTANGPPTHHADGERDHQRAVDQMVAQVRRGCGPVTVPPGRSRHGSWPVRPGAGHGPTTAAAQQPKNDRSTGSSPEPGVRYAGTDRRACRAHATRRRATAALRPDVSTRTVRRTRSWMRRRTAIRSRPGSVVGAGRTGGMDRRVGLVPRAPTGVTRASTYCTSAHRGRGLRRAARRLPPRSWAVDLCTGIGAVAAHLIRDGVRAARRHRGRYRTAWSAPACARANGVPTLVGDLADPVDGDDTWTLITGGRAVRPDPGRAAPAGRCPALRAADGARRWYRRSRPGPADGRCGRAGSCGPGGGWVVVELGGDPGRNARPYARPTDATTPGALVRRVRRPPGPRSSSRVTAQEIGGPLEVRERHPPRTTGIQNVARRKRKTDGTATSFGILAATRPAIVAASNAPTPPGCRRPRRWQRDQVDRAHLGDAQICTPGRLDHERRAPR